LFLRIEKLAGSLSIPVLTSAAGQAELESLIECEPAGAHELKGFEGKHEFLAVSAVSHDARLFRRPRRAHHHSV
jgi:hypothetical protein